MKTLKYIMAMVMLLILWILFTIVTILAKKNEIINRTEMIIENQDTVEIVSPVIDFPSDFSNVPSYCDPKNYRIGKTNNEYIVLMPHGTYAESYKTIQEAQRSINEYARHSMERWLKSGGRDF